MSLSAAERLSVLALTVVGMVLPSPSAGLDEQGRATLAYTFYITPIQEQEEEEEVTLTVPTPCPTFGSEISDALSYPPSTILVRDRANASDTITTYPSSNIVGNPSDNVSDKVRTSTASDKRYCR